MRRVRLGLIALLLVYTLGILGIEWFTSQTYVRHYLADIAGPVRLWAINTTVTTFLLTAGALLYALNLYFVEGAEHARTRVFFLSQIAVYLYLAADERLVIHELIGRETGTHDSVTLLLVGVTEVVLLLTLGSFRSQPRPLQALWLGSAGFAACMFFVDIFVDEFARMRLSLEDMFKTWSIFLLFAVPLLMLHWNIVALKRRAAEASR